MNEEKFMKLLKRIHEGDMQALEPIYDEYYGKMVFTAMSILKDEDSSRDVASEIINKLIDRVEYDVPDVKNADAYMYVSVYNLAVTVYNNRKRIVSLDYAPHVRAQDFTEKVINKITITQLSKALDSDELRILDLRINYRYKLTEIAKELDMPEGTVKWKMSEIRRKMEEMFKREKN